MKPIKSLSISLTLVAVLALLAAFAAWLAWTAACLYDPGLPLCRHPAGGWIIIIGAAAIVLGWAGLLVRERLRRRLTRGMYARPAVARRGWFERTARSIFEAGPDATHPLDLPANYGWQVSLDDGTRVNVFVDELWGILNDAWQFQHNPANCRYGALSQRRLDPKIGRPRTLAVNYLVDLAGGVRKNKDTTNSTRRLNATPWSIMTALMEAWPPGEV
jgi:hypothetical protein